MTQHPFDAVTLAELRRRTSAKWTVYPADVIPAWIAEMDYPLAGPIRRALEGAIARDDVGYASVLDLGDAFATFARRRFALEVDPTGVMLAADVVTAIGEILRAGTAPGDGVVIEPPVYPPFASTITQTGRKVLEAPLREGARGLEPDLDAIESAYREGARAHLLCSPHNPAGRVIPRETLAAIGELAARHGVLVLADEIHAPLTLPGATHLPFPMASELCAESSILLTSASKTWNLAGLKAALMIPFGARGRDVLARLPHETPYHAGHLGVIASRAAFLEGEAWLEDALTILDRNRARLGELLAHHLPDARCSLPDASYLAWIDLRAYGLGDDPARALLERARVALSPGPSFGAGGAGLARLNFATTGAILEEIVERMASAIRGARPPNG